MLKEEWKPIPNYNGVYWISNFGRIISYQILEEGKYMSPGRWLKKNKNGEYRGYMKVRLTDNNKTLKTFTIHHLVWDNFGNKPRNGIILQVDHIDNNRLNNRIDNLQLLTPKQNNHWNKNKTK